MKLERCTCCIDKLILWCRMDNLDTGMLEELLSAVGEHLAEGGDSAAIVVVGGSTLALRGWVARTTQDVDVIAQARDEGDRFRLIAPEPLSVALREAVIRVARDYGLPPDWLNTVIGAQWDFGLPDGFAEELEWRHYGPLTVGFAGRQSLLALKLFAAVDRSRESVHFQDLVALAPSDPELEEAATWVRSQDSSEHFPTLVKEVVASVRHDLGRDGTAR